MIELALPYPPTTGNHTTKRGNGRFYTQDKVKAYRQAVASILAQQGMVLGLEGPIVVDWRVAPPDRRAVDEDNLLKIIKDALTRAGFWVDDSNKVIRRTTFTWLDPIAGGWVGLSVALSGATIATD